MRRLIYLALFCCSVAYAQPGSLMLTGMGGPSASGVTVTGGAVWLGGASASVTGNAAATVQGVCGASWSAVSGCTMQIPPTTAGSTRVCALVDENNENMYAASCYDCTSSGGCNSGNALDTYTVSGTQAWQKRTTNDTIDETYATNGASGATYITIVPHTAPANSNMWLEYVEMMPPTCSGSPCSTSLDSYLGNSGAGPCSPCTTSAMTLSSRDFIVGIVDSSNYVRTSGTWALDFIGNMFAQDVSSDPGVTLTTASWYTIGQMAFKTAGGTYTPPTNNYAYLRAQTGSPWALNSSAYAGTSFTASLPQTTVAGDTGYVDMVDIGGTGHITALTAGLGTATIPSGASTCQILTTNEALSCAVVLNLNSGVTSITVTTTTCADCLFRWVELTHSTGTCSIDAQNSSTGGTGTILTGQALALSGNDTIFSSMAWDTTNTKYLLYQGLYPYMASESVYTGSFTTPTDAALMITNTSSGAAPTVLVSGSVTSSTRAALAILCH